MKRLVSRAELIASTLKGELSALTRSVPIMLVIIGGVVGYGILYNLLYRPNVVRQVAVALVDEAFDENSRHLGRMLDATPQIALKSVTNAATAKQLLESGEVMGIIILPEDLTERLGRREQAIFLSLATTSTLLHYQAISEAVVGVMEEFCGEQRPELVGQLKPEQISAIMSAGSIEPIGVALYNPSRGYADYLIPVVLILILFQTMVMAITMRIGDQKQHGGLASYGVCGTDVWSMSLVVAVKAMVYIAIYTLLSIFILGLVPILFDLPYCTSLWRVALVVVPMLAATSLFAIALSCLFRDSDSPLLLIAPFSVGLIFLSGISFPAENMPRLWQAVSNIFPSSPAIMAYVRTVAMGCSPTDIAPELHTLWLQCAIYGVLAVVCMRQNVAHEE